MENGLLNGLIILGIICLSLGTIALLYGIVAIRRRGIMIQKMDYLIEDITYKSEMLNSTVETISKVSNYIDIFDVVTRKNIKSFVSVVAKNKEDIYKILDNLKKIAMGEVSKKQKKETPKKPKHKKPSETNTTTKNNKKSVKETNDIKLQENEIVDKEVSKQKPKKSKIHFLRKKGENNV